MSGAQNARIHAAARLFAGDKTHSVSGIIYAAPRGASPAPIVELFTKANCPLCDDAKAVLQQCAVDVPHSLVAVDITDLDLHTEVVPITARTRPVRISGYQFLDITAPV